MDRETGLKVTKVRFFPFKPSNSVYLRVFFGGGAGPVCNGKDLKIQKQIVDWWNLVRITGGTGWIYFFSLLNRLINKLF